MPVFGLALAKVPNEQAIEAVLSTVATISFKIYKPVLARNGKRGFFVDLVATCVSEVSPMCLGGFLGSLGGLLGASCAYQWPLSGLLGPSWASWGLLGTSWGAQPYKAPIKALKG